MKFAKQEFTQRVSRLEKLLEEDFVVLAGAVRTQHHAHHQRTHKQKLIEQLQYHDIIRQKIQHVGEFADVLESEFRLHDKSCDVCVLPGLLELSMALLQFARLEYDEVREEIKVQLLALSHQLDPSVEKYDLFQLEMQEMIKCLGRMYLHIESPDQQLDEELSLEKLKAICQTFSMQTEREIFRSLFNDKTQLQNLPEDREISDDIELF